jgi:hypothetical protein
MQPHHATVAARTARREDIDCARQPDDENEPDPHGCNDRNPPSRPLAKRQAPPDLVPVTGSNYSVAA